MSRVARDVIKSLRIGRTRKGCQGAGRGINFKTGDRVLTAFRAIKIVAARVDSEVGGLVGAELSTARIGWGGKRAAGNWRQSSIRLIYRVPGYSTSPATRTILNVQVLS